MNPHPTNTTNPVDFPKSIWQRRRELDQARRLRNQELMQEYDQTVYQPQMLALQAECAAIWGHSGGTPHDNGLGWTWTYCSQCGARYNMQGPQ